MVSREMESHLGHLALSLMLFATVVHHLLLLTPEVPASDNL